MAPQGEPDRVTDAALLAIARRHLGLETLETRSSDSLDFKEQAVWSVEAALRAAFEAGRRAAAAEVAPTADAGAA